MSRAPRFRPPAIAATPELTWVLARAFGPAAVSVEVGDAAVAVELARRLGLAPRIGSRRGLPELAGTALARELARDSATAAASEMLAQAAAREVARAAAEAGAACCFLKGVALDALGVLAPGSRGISDVDVLAAPAAAAGMAEALTARGFVAAGTGYPHQLPPQVHRELGCVEVHRHLPGVRVVAAAGFATLPELRGEGHLAPWPGVEGEALLPTRPLLAAHLLAHGIAQHGHAPEGYPLLRMLADLVDLGFGGPTGDALAAEAAALLGGTLEPAEVAAARELCGALAAGEIAVLGSDGDAGTLLRHLVAAHLDDGYRQALKLRGLSRPLDERSPATARLAALGAALWPSATQLDAIYGRPAGPLGRARQRAWRPLDLARRAWRSWAAARR